MVTLNPYINLPGTTEEAFNFYKNIFTGVITILQRFGDTGEKDKMPVEDHDKLMHITMRFGKNNILMGTDVVESMGHKFIPGNNFMLSLSVESEAEADQIFKGLSEGAQVTMPLHKTFWNAYFGMLTDKFGIG